MVRPLFLVFFFCAVICNAQDKTTAQTAETEYIVYVPGITWKRVAAIKDATEKIPGVSYKGICPSGRLLFFTCRSVSPDPVFHALHELNLPYTIKTNCTIKAARSACSVPGELEQSMSTE